MRSRVEEKKHAIELRKQGFSYKEILKFVPVGKSTLSGWFKDLELEPIEIAHLELTAKKNLVQGRAKALAVVKQNRQISEERARMTATNMFDLYRHHPDFLIGLSLYWSEGSQYANAVEFTNSNAVMIRFMLLWLKKYLMVKDREIMVRLYVQHVYRNEDLEAFWEQYLNLPAGYVKKTVFKPTATPSEKLSTYKGCLKIYINRVEYLRIVMAWQKMMLGNYIFAKNK